MRNTTGPIEVGNGSELPPRPGIGPLRPRTAGEIVTGAIRCIRKNASATAGLTVVAVIVLVATLYGVVTLTVGVGDLVRDPVLATSPFSRAGAFTIIVVVALITGTTTSGVFIVVLSRAVIGRRTGIPSAMSVVRRRLPGLLGVYLLSGLVTCAVAGVGVLLIVVTADAGVVLPFGFSLLIMGFTIAGVLLSFRLAITLTLAGPAYVLENIGVAAALSRARELAAGRWWRVLGVLLLAYVVFYGFCLGFVIVGVSGGLIVTAAAGIDGWWLTLGSAIVSIPGFGFPFFSCVVTLLYVDLRIRDEHIEFTLARSATAAEPAWPRDL